MGTLRPRLAGRDNLDRLTEPATDRRTRKLWREWWYLRLDQNDCECCRQNTPRLLFRHQNFKHAQSSGMAARSPRSLGDRVQTAWDRKLSGRRQFKSVTTRKDVFDSAR